MGSSASHFKKAEPEDKLVCSTCHRGMPKPVPYVPGENKKALEEAAKQEGMTPSPESKPS